MIGISNNFARYTGFDPKVQVYRLTSESVSAIHRFYDTSPLSPSGRYVAVTEFPTEMRLPLHGEKATVRVIDLQSGESIFSQETAAWDTQVGAHAQWGTDDRQLYFNELDDRANIKGVCVDIQTGARRIYDMGIYMISPDGATIAAPSVEKLCIVQPGYGVVMPDPEVLRNKGAPENDGLFVGDVQSGSVRLLVSMSTIAQTFPKQFSEQMLRAGGLYGFHVKWSPSSERLMFIVRWVPSTELARGTKNYLITMRKDGTDLRMAIDNDRWVGGHHPNWSPDSESIVMNLRFPKGNRYLVKGASLFERLLRKAGFRVSFDMNPLKLAMFRYDGAIVRSVGGVQPGSGHPTVTPDLKNILTDAYPGESVAFKDGSVPIRLISIADGRCRQLIRIKCKPAFSGSKAELRVDPHPAWSRDGRQIVFNGCPGDRRGVFIADLSSVEY
nr:hypothetical protein [uncultured Gellertiella sp.]